MRSREERNDVYNRINGFDLRIVYNNKIRTFNNGNQ